MSEYGYVICMHVSGRHLQMIVGVCGSQEYQVPGDRVKGGCKVLGSELPYCKNDKCS